MLNHDPLCLLLRTLLTTLLQESHQHHHQWAQSTNSAHISTAGPTDSYLPPSLFPCPWYQQCKEFYLKYSCLFFSPQQQYFFHMFSCTIMHVFVTTGVRTFIVCGKLQRMKWLSKLEILYQEFFLIWYALLCSEIISVIQLITWG